MRRTYTSEQYADTVARLRAAFGEDRVSFTTDVIVGFPGETEEEFCESMAFVQRIGFLKAHVFPYSRRAGTPAADFPDQIPEEEKARRVHRMQTAADATRDALIARMAGNRAEVLLETPLSSSLFTGYTKLYVPVVVSAPGHKSGEILPVTLGEFDGQRCRAELAL